MPVRQVTMTTNSTPAKVNGNIHVGDFQQIRAEKLNRRTQNRDDRQPGAARISRRPHCLVEEPVVSSMVVETAVHTRRRADPNFEGDGRTEVASSKAS